MTDREPFDDFETTLGLFCGCLHSDRCGDCAEVGAAHAAALEKRAAQAADEERRRYARTLAHPKCRNAHGHCDSCHDDVNEGYSDEIVCCRELDELESENRRLKERAAYQNCMEGRADD